MDTQRHTNTDTHGHTHTDMDTHSHTNTDTHIHTHTDTHTRWKNCFPTSKSQIYYIFKAQWGAWALWSQGKYNCLTAYFSIQLGGGLLKWTWVCGHLSLDGVFLRNLSLVVSTLFLNGVVSGRVFFYFFFFLFPKEEKQIPFEVFNWWMSYDK